MPTLFNFDLVKRLLTVINDGAVTKAKNNGPAKSCFDSDAEADVVGNDGAGVASGNEELLALIHESKLGDKKEAPLPDMLSEEAESEKEEDDVLSYMKERATITECLDHPKFIGPAPFSTFRLF